MSGAPTMQLESLSVQGEEEKSTSVEQLQMAPFKEIDIPDAITSPLDQPVSRILKDIVDLTAHTIVLFLVTIFQIGMDWLPSYITPLKEGFLTAVVWMAFIVRVGQNVIDVLFLSTDLYHTALGLVGLTVYMVFYQPYLMLREFIAKTETPDTEFLPEALKEHTTPFEWRRRLNAVKYARAMYENTPAGILFAYGTLLSPTSILGTLQGIVSSILETFSLGTLIRKNFLERELPDKWQANAEHIWTFKPQFGFARFTLPVFQTDRIPNFFWLFPPSVPQFTPIFTPLTALYKDYAFDPTKRSVLVLVTRGSTSLRDWFVDANCWASGCTNVQILRHGHGSNQYPTKLGSAFDIKGQDRVHIGIYMATVDLFQRTQAVVGYQLRKGDVDELIITGHSLGGGTAVYLTKMYQDAFPELKVTGYAFAPPECHSVCQQRMVHTFRYKDDIVTRLGFTSVERFLTELIMKVEEVLHLRHEDWIVGDECAEVTTTLGKVDPDVMWNQSLIKQVECHAPWNYDHALRVIVKFMPTIQSFPDAHIREQMATRRMSL